MRARSIDDVAAMLDVLCPMHALLDATGHVVHAGPTLRKLLGDRALIDRRLLEALELKRPRIGGTMAELRGAGGRKLRFALRAPPRTEIKGVLVPLPCDGSVGPAGGAIVNLSLGLSVVDAVRDYALTSADFAATDLTVEMLYLVEAKSAAMEASHKLNLRLQGAKVAAEEQAFTDTLTGLKNRRALEPVLTRLIEGGGDFALMNLDLDYFKTINDTLGHAAGDHVLRQVAIVLGEETRGEDTVIRTGGDEFVLILARLADRERLSEIAMRLIERLERPIPFKDRDCRISASIGATLSRDYDNPSLAGMLEDADVALYAAKGRGRGRHVIYAPDLRQETRVPEAGRAAV